MQNNLDQLIELIKQEKVCLWIGSGLSIYAGYPNVQVLKEEIIKQIPEEFKDDKYNHQNLADLCEAFIGMHDGDRQELNQILLRLYKRPPESTYTHDLLSKIPYFKTIITTNYDEMIENAYANRAVIVREPKDRVRLNHRMVTIYKIHGCVNALSRIVISKGDYDKLYHRNFKTDFWNSIFHEIASKHHLFIGYGYEDGNVKSDFEYFLEHSTDHQLRRFHISPSLDKLKEKEFARHNIRHFNLTGDSFFEMLIQRLKDSLGSDIRNKVISTDSAAQFVASFDIKAQFETKGASATLLSLSKMEGETNHQTDISIDDEQISRDFMKFLKGDNRLSYKLKGSALKDFRYQIEGFGVLGLEDIAEITVKSVPSATGICRIKFPKDTFEISGLNYELYKGNGAFSLIVKQDKLKISIYYETGGKVNFSISRNLEISDVKRAAAFFKFLLLVSQGASFTILTPGKKNIDMVGVKCESNFDFIVERLSIYESLDMIEDKFNVVFPKFKEDVIQDRDIGNIKKLRSLIENGYFLVATSEEIKLDEMLVDDELLATLENFDSREHYLVMEMNRKNDFTLLGANINLGNDRLVIYEPIVNKEKLKAGVVRIRSNIGRIGYTYEDFPPYREFEKKRLLWEASDEYNSILNRTIKR